MANVSTTSDKSVNVSTTSDESVKRKIRQKVYYARGLDFTRSIKGNREQLERGQALKIFRDGYHTCPKVLMATDESPGSAEDIPTVDIVVCYDIPDTIDEYERRIGRARSNGMATSF